MAAEEVAAGKRKIEAGDWPRREVAAALKDLLAMEVSTCSARLGQMFPREGGGICGQCYSSDAPEPNPVLDYLRTAWVKRPCHLGPPGHSATPPSPRLVCASARRVAMRLHQR